MKTVFVSAKSSTNTLKSEFLAYYKEKIAPSVIASMKEALGIESLVVEDTNFMKGTGPDGTARAYKFRGFGCSISSLKYDKRSKLAAKIEEVFRECRNKECLEIVKNAFDAKLLAKLQAEGTPFGALFYQDMEVNSTLFWGVVRFAMEKGVKNIDYVTRLD